MDRKNLLAIALLGGGAYLVYRGAKEQGLLGTATPTGLAPVPPDNTGYVPYVPPQPTPPPEQIEPYREPTLPPPPSGMTVPQMLRQFFSYLSLYSMYREREYKSRYEEIVPQILAVAGEKTKDQVVTPDIVEVLLSRYYVGRAKPMGPRPYGGWGSTRAKYEGFGIWDKHAKKRYALTVSTITATIATTYQSVGTTIQGDLLSLRMADRLMKPNIPIADFVFQAIELAPRVRMPLEVFLLPTWSAAHNLPYYAPYTTGIRPPLDWLRFWISRGYKPRFAKVPQLKITRYTPEHWFVIEPNRKVSPRIRDRLLKLIDQIKIKYSGEIITSYAGRSRYSPAARLWLQFETLLTV